MSTFVFLNSILQVLQKVSLLNNILNNKKYLYGRTIYDKPIFCLRVYGLLYITILTYSYTSLKYFNFQNNICTYRYLTEIQCFVHMFYINDMDNSLGPIHEFSF